MRLYNTTHEFAYSWDEVSTANWRKYCPWNDKSPHVIAVDTLSRSLSPTTNILRTERLITCKQSAPKWLQSIFGSSDVSHVYEVSYVDPTEGKERVVMCSQNITWSELLSVQEKVVYSPAGHGRTQLEQSAKIVALCGGWQKIKNSIEEVSIKQFQQNAAKGREGFEKVLAISRQVFAEQREQARREKEGQVA